MIDSNEYEQEALGRILQHGDKALMTMSALSAEHFYSVQHQEIFKASLAVDAAGGQVNVVTVKNELERQGLDADMFYMADLVKNSMGASLERYEVLIIDRYKARQAIASAHSLVAQLEETNGANAQEMIHGLTQTLDGLLLTEVDTDATFDHNDLLKIALDEFEKRVDADGQMVGLTTGIKALDEKLNGLQGGNVYVMAGRPGMGKTAVSMGIAEHVATVHKDKGMALVFNMEMSKEQLAMRSLAALAGVSLQHLQSGNNDDGMNYARMSDAFAKDKKNMLVDLRAGMTMAQIRAKAKTVKNKHGLSMILIDYLQLITGSGNDLREKATEISRQVKVLAKDLDVPIILLSQLSRKCEERTDKRPLASDLRDSGAIEQDADVILMLYRDDKYKPEGVPKDGTLEIGIEKNRMGEEGTVYAKFEGHFSRVREYDDFDYRDAMQRAMEPRGHSKAQANRSLM